MPPKLSQKQTVIVNIGDKVIKKKKRKRRKKTTARQGAGVAYPANQQTSAFVAQAQQITLAQSAQALQLQSLANRQGHNNLITDGRDSEIKRITAERDQGLKLLEQQRSAQEALPPARPSSAPVVASFRDMSAQPDVRPEFQREQAERKQRTRGVGFAQPNRPTSELSKLEKQEQEQEPYFEPPPAFRPDIAEKHKKEKAEAEEETRKIRQSTEAVIGFSAAVDEREKAAKGMADALRLSREAREKSRQNRIRREEEDAEARRKELERMARPTRQPSPPPSLKQVEKQETVEFLKAEEAKKIDLAPPVLPEKRQRATKEEMRIRREKEAENFSQKRETVLMADAEYTQRQIAQRRAELPPPPPPPPPPSPPPPSGSGVGASSQSAFSLS